MIQQRTLGHIGISVSALGFGCGAVGGLLVRGDRDEMARVVDRAIDAGITYFDTATSYGDGASEENLGRILAQRQRAVTVGTKVRLQPQDLDRIPTAVVESVEGSLTRLRRDSIDLIQLHNRIAGQRSPEQAALTPSDLAVVAETFQGLIADGKVQHWGITGLGEPALLHQAIAETQLETIQSCYNMLNPSAGREMGAGFPFEDYGALIEKAGRRGVGVIAIRVLAGGALSGATARHPVAAPAPNPIGSSADLATDVARAQRLRFLVDEGHVETLVEAALRFALANDRISTALIGFSDGAQLDQALTYAERGPLPAELVERIYGIEEL